MDWQVNTIVSYIQYCIAPPRCAHCRTPLLVQAPLCAPCLKQLQPIVSYHFQASTTLAVPVHAAAVYDGPMRTLILQKHVSNISACYTLAHLIIDRTPFTQIACDALIPVPLHWTRHYQRGFNQAHEIALQLSRHKHCPVIGLVKRHKQTVFQSTLSGEQRKKNVADAFILSASENTINQWKNKHLVIVDDLITSGSTLCALACSLVKLKPASITAIVACRARLQ